MGQIDNPISAMLTSRINQCRPLVLGLILCALTTACRDERPPRFDRMTGMIFADAIAAISERKHELAVDKLHRLDELVDDNELVYYVGREQEDNITISRARQAAENDDFDKAIAILEKRITRDGTSRRLEKAMSKMRGFVQVRAYRNAGPFEHASDAMKAVKKLPSPDVFADSPSYSDWLKGEQKRAEALLETERQRLVLGLLHSVDLAIVQGLSTDTQWAQIGTLAPLEPLYRLYLRQFSTTISPYQVDELQSSGIRYDLAYYQYFIAQSKPRQQKLAKTVAATQPASLTGLHLRTWAAALDQQWFRVLDGVGSMFSRVPNPRFQVVTEQLQQSYWRERPAITPTVHSILQQLYTVQDLP